jgi:hypothetical protein
MDNGVGLASGSYRDRFGARARLFLEGILKQGEGDAGATLPGDGAAPRRLA